MSISRTCKWVSECNTSPDTNQWSLVEWWSYGLNTQIPTIPISIDIVDGQKFDRITGIFVNKINKVIKAVVDTHGSTEAERPIKWLVYARDLAELQAMEYNLHSMQREGDIVDGTAENCRVFKIEEAIMKFRDTALWDFRRQGTAKAPNVRKDIKNNSAWKVHDLIEGKRMTMKRKPEIEEDNNSNKRWKGGDLYKGLLLDQNSEHGQSDFDMEP